jgi:hypothetical protein
MVLQRSSNYKKVHGPDEHNNGSDEGELVGGEP